MSIHSAQTSAQNPGWLIVMPDGYPYAWYCISEHASAGAAFEAFEPDQCQRSALSAQGWSVQAGDAIELLSPRALQRASA